MHESKTARTAAAILGLVIGTKLSDVLSDCLEKANLPPVPGHFDETSRIEPELPEKLSLRIVMPGPNDAPLPGQVVAVLSATNDDPFSTHPTFEIPREWIEEHPHDWMQAQNDIFTYLSSPSGELDSWQRGEQVKDLIVGSCGDLSQFRQSLGVLSAKDLLEHSSI